MRNLLVSFDLIVSYRIAVKPLSLSLSLHLCETSTGRQWSSGNMPDCGVRGPRFESHRGQLHVYRKHYCDIQPWARAVHPYCSA